MIKIKISEPQNEYPAKIKVVGVGGGGSNAVNRMIAANVHGVEFITMNTDAQALRCSVAPIRIQIGEKISRGLGVGGNPSRGAEAAQESRDRIKEVLMGADMVFITAGMGGGTGTGGAPIVAEVAKSLDILTVGVVTRPFDFEHRTRQAQADEGIKNLRAQVDTLIVIPNEKIFTIVDDKTPIQDAFRIVDDVLRQAVQSITDIINKPGEINVDFADVCSIMRNAGEALMGIGESSGPERAVEAARKAIASPLLDDVSIDGARGVLINVTGNQQTSMVEVREAMNHIRESVSAEAHLFYGQVIDTNMEDRLKITVIATGFPPRRKSHANYTAGHTGDPFNIQQNSGSAQKETIDWERPAYMHWKSRKLK